jgi:hypothetical protein
MGMWRGIWRVTIRLSYDLAPAEGDASSRWLIDIRTDLIPPRMTMDAAAISMPMAGRKAIRWRSWRG